MRTSPLFDLMYFPPIWQANCVANWMQTKNNLSSARIVETAALLVSSRFAIERIHLVVYFHHVHRIEFVLLIAHIRGVPHYHNHHC